MNYDMRVSERINKKPIDENGCFHFTESSINNIPDINIFVETEINKAITEGCKEVLRRSMNRKNNFRYGEQGLLISTVDKDSNGNVLPHIHEYFAGGYHRIITDDKYRSIVATRPIRDLVFIHNHPNNSSFSAADLKSLTTRKSLIAIVAIGNRHNLFVVINNASNSKVPNYIENYIKDFQKKNGIVINKQKRKMIEAEAAKKVLENYEMFQLDYYKLRRRPQ